MQKFLQHKQRKPNDRAAGAESEIFTSSFIPDGFTSRSASHHPCLIQVVKLLATELELQLTLILTFICQLLMQFIRK